MMHLIKAELQKVLTTRTTYALMAVTFAITAFVSFYIIGYRGAYSAAQPTMLAGSATIIVSQIVFLIGLPGVLLVANEYRYSTIIYTLTSSNSRLKVLFTKAVVISVLSVLLTLAFAALTALLTYAGARLKGLDIAAQDIPYLDLLWRMAFYGWGYSMLAMIFAFIIRNQIGTIVALIFLPGTIEGLLGLLLKENNFYLPFSALNSVLNNTPFSHGKAALIVVAYLIVGWAITAILFKRRDAN